MAYIDNYHSLVTHLQNLTNNELVKLFCVLLLSTFQ